MFTKDSPNFMNNIRIYNNLFAFARFGAKLVTFPIASPQVFCICGETYLNSYSLDNELVINFKIKIVKIVHYRY